MGNIEFVDYTQEQRDAIILAVSKWMKEHHHPSGESIYQVDRNNIDSVDLVADIADIINDN